MNSLHRRAGRAGSTGSTISRQAGAPQGRRKRLHSHRPRSRPQFSLGPVRPPPGYSGKGGTAFHAVSIHRQDACVTSAHQVNLPRRPDVPFPQQTVRSMHRTVFSRCPTAHCSLPDAVCLPCRGKVPPARHAAVPAIVLPHRTAPRSFPPNLALTVDRLLSNRLGSPSPRSRQPSSNSRSPRLKRCAILNVWPCVRAVGAWAAR